MNKTKIEWCDYTWNPASGCYGIGCKVRHVCWARKQVRRLARFCSKCPTFIPHMHWTRLEEPLHLKKPAKIFVVSTGDLFGLKPEHTKAILKVIGYANWHIFQLLTKLPQNARNFNPYPNNVWFGVTVNMQADVWRLNILQEIKAKVKFCSFEPLYSNIDYNIAFLDWIIIGAQTRPLLSPKKKWVMALIEQARKYDIPVFIKNNLKWPKKIQVFPEAISSCKEAGRNDIRSKYNSSR